MWLMVKWHSSLRLIARWPDFSGQHPPPRYKHSSRMSAPLIVADWWDPSPYFYNASRGVGFPNNPWIQGMLRSWWLFVMRWIDMMDPFRWLWVSTVRSVRPETCPMGLWEPRWQPCSKNDVFLGGALASLSVLPEAQEFAETIPR